MNYEKSRWYRVCGGIVETLRCLWLIGALLAFASWLAHRFL